MKRTLWIPLVAIVASAAYILRRERARTEAPSASVAETHAAPDARDRAADDVVLSKAPAAETSQVEPPHAVRMRDTIPPTSTAADPTAPPPLLDLSTAVSTTVETAIAEDERARFAEKYALASRDVRRAAREKLESFVLAQNTGTLEKSQVVADEEILAMRREIAWLVDHPSP